MKRSKLWLKTRVEEADQPWQLWCRLCAKTETKDNIRIFGKTENNDRDTLLATAIGKYFWVNIKAEDKISTQICRDCHTLIDSLVSFTDRVTKVQAMYCLLENKIVCEDEELERIRCQYGLSNAVSIFSNLNVNTSENNYEAEEKQLLIKQLTESEESGEEHLLYEGLSDDEMNFELTDDEGTTLRRVHHKKARYQTTDDEEAYMETDEEFLDIAESIEMKEESLFEGFEGAEVDDDNADDVNETNETENNDADDPDAYVDDNEGTTNFVKINKKKKSSNESDSKIDGNEKNVEDSIEMLQFKRKRGRPSKNSQFILNSSQNRDQQADLESSFKYECKICFRKYKNPTPYRKHVAEIHNKPVDIPEFMCTKCSKVFPTERQLASHVRVHLPRELKLDIGCPFCDKKFTKIPIMKQHVRGIHQNEKPYICDNCGRALKTLAALKEHKLVHTTECPYECDICHKRFKNKPRLKVHKDTHNETAYVCMQCGMQLNTRRTLKMHMLVHTDEKQYKCNFCGSAFKRTKALKNHLILHTGLRPYKCSFCDKTFANGSNCRSHKKKMHPRELAEEEALGFKTKTLVPNIEELKSSRNIIEKPRNGQRSSGGLPLHLRALLIAAEERDKRKKTEAMEQDSIKKQESEGTIGVSEESEDDLNPATIIMNEEDDEEEAEETVIFEIIDEI